jgi:hypothetical protein
MRLKALIVIGTVTVIVAGWIFLSRSMRLGYVDSAIGSMRILVAAEAKYAQTHPKIGYTCTLSALSSDDSTFELVRNGRRNQYAFEINGCVGNGKSPNAQYQIRARPLLTGMPAFCSDQSGIVKYDESGSTEKCHTSGIPVG